MKLHVLLAAIVLLVSSGCFGLPEGAADTGDTATIRYTALDAATGQELRGNRTATFVVGSGASGLGLALERAVRGHLPNDTFELRVSSDSSLAFSGEATADRHLAPIPIVQNASRAEFDGSQFGPATVGKQFPAYGIYDGIVTAVGNTSVTFEIRASDGQRDPVPSVGCILVSRIVGSDITRELEPVVGSVFAIQPPSIYQRSTPLGLEPGSYKVLGSTEDKIVFGHSTSTEVDLIGKALVFKVTVVRVVPGTSSNVPTGDDYGMRNSPQVNGDPYSAVADAEADGADEHPH